MPGTESKDPAATPQIVLREVREFVRKHEQRRRQLPRALLVGLIAGLAAVAFRGALAEAERLRHQLVLAAYGHPALGWIPLVSFCAFGVALSIFLVRRYAPDASGSGIPQVKAILHGVKNMVWWRILVVKFVGGVSGIGAGLALGREGPTIQMGAAVGQMVSGWFRCTPRERRTLIASGAGAGLAAAFNAPLSGLVFVLEELQRDFSPGIFTTTLIASAVADVTTRSLLGQLPVFHVQFESIPSLSSLPASLVVGVVAGLLGVAFNRGLLRSLAFFDRHRRRSSWTVGALVGALVGMVALLAPDTVGGGHPLVERTLAGRLTVLPICGFFVLRFFLTMMSYGCGAPGGIFAPLLVLGAQIGLAVGEISAWWFPQAVILPQTFAVVGMAAYFTAIVRAPLTGIVLIVEMTGNYSLVLPLLVACLTAYGVADFLRDRPVYEALLERDLLRGQETPELEGALLLDLTIAPGASFDGQRVRDLGLPPGCLVVLVRRGLREEVPTADWQLTAGDQISVVIAPKAAVAVPLLQEGAGLASQ
jgi:CIC family chloride channel protein